MHAVVVVFMTTSVDVYDAREGRWRLVRAVFSLASRIDISEVRRRFRPSIRRVVWTAILPRVHSSATFVLHHVLHLRLFLRFILVASVVRVVWHRRMVSSCTHLHHHHHVVFARPRRFPTQAKQTWRNTRDVALSCRSTTANTCSCRVLCSVVSCRVVSCKGETSPGPGQGCILDETRTQMRTRTGRMRVREETEPCAAEERRRGTIGEVRRVTQTHPIRRCTRACPKTQAGALRQRRAQTHLRTSTYTPRPGGKGPRVDGDTDGRKENVKTEMEEEESKRVGMEEKKWTGLWTKRCATHASAVDRPCDAIFHSNRTHGKK